MNILIVEDEAVLASYMLLIVRQLGHEGFIAKSKDEIRETLAKEEINAAFVDVVLDKDSGIDIGHCLTYRAGIPVVFTTSIEDEFNVAKMLAIGWYLKKPVRLAGIARAIEWFQQCGKTASPYACYES